MYAYIVLHNVIEAESKVVAKAVDQRSFRVDAIADQ